MNKKNYKTKVVIGAQWGDEGKGKVSDYLAQNVDIVVRYQGGNNAGHSIEFDGNRYALNHIPSGIFNPNTTNIMGQGMVINPKMLVDEIDYLEKKGIKKFKLLISDRSHIILPYHLDLDAAYEKLKESINPNKKIGTTKKGIGPTYEDKVSRIGIRFGDFIVEEAFKEVLEDALLIKNKQLESMGLKKYLVSQIFDEYKKYAFILKKYVCETGSFLAKKLNDGASALFEGAQGVMLCIENGTYPFVTSSSPTASAIPLGAGINTHFINDVIGIIKAYSTRVGEGAMPTLLENVNPKIATFIRERGKEFGTVTGRPRKVGWLDIVAIKHAIRVSGLTEVAITLLDVLTGLKEIKIAYAYELDEKEINYIPGSNFVYSKCKPKYISVLGWTEDITTVKSFDELPINAKKYIQKIEELINIPVRFFSVGPDRNQTIEI